MKKKVLALLVSALAWIATGCASSGDETNSTSKQSSQITPQVTQSSSKPSATTPTPSTKPKEEMRSEVKTLLIKLESKLKSADDKLLEIKSKYGDIRNAPSADIDEWSKRLEEYSACLKEVHAIDLNSAEWDYYMKIGNPMH